MSKTPVAKMTKYRLKQEAFRFFALSDSIGQNYMIEHPKSTYVDYLNANIANVLKKTILLQREGYLDSKIDLFKPHSLDELYKYAETAIANKEKRRIVPEQKIKVELEMPTKHVIPAQKDIVDLIKKVKTKKPKKVKLQLQMPTKHAIPAQKDITQMIEAMKKPKNKSQPIVSAIKSVKEISSNTDDIAGLMKSAVKSLSRYYKTDDESGLLTALRNVKNASNKTDNVSGHMNDVAKQLTLYNDSF